MIPAIVLFSLLTSLAGCSETSPAVANPEETPKSSGITGTVNGPVSWGTAILNLVPGRSGDAVTTEAEVRIQFSSCKFGSSGSAVRSGECSAEQMIPDRPQGLDRLQVQILSEGESIPVLRLVACCTDESVQPFQGQPVIKAEKLCPEVTLVASQSAHVFRVSAPGKRDFVHAQISHAAGAKSVTSHTILLAASDAGSECTDVVAAEKRLDAQFGAPSTL